MLIRLYVVPSLLLSFLISFPACGGGTSNQQSSSGSSSSGNSALPSSGTTATPSGTWAWGSNQGIMWGVGDIVPDMPMSASQQIAATQDLGFQSVRVWCDSVHDPSVLAPPAQAVGITPTVLISKATQVAGAGQAANYAYGYSAAETCVEETGVGMNIIYEVGNELDNWVGITDGGDGSDISQYNQSNLIDAVGYIQGMIAGVKALNPKALVAVNSAGWCHYGFLTGLWNDYGIRWDITDEHWYGNQGDLLQAGCENGINVLNVLKTFGKPIIVTEINVNANEGAFTKAQMASYFQSEMPELDGVAEQYDLENVDIFFLQDIPDLTYGIFNGDGSESAAYPVIQNFFEANPSARYEVGGPSPPPPRPRTGTFGNDTRNMLIGPNWRDFLGWERFDRKAIGSISKGPDISNRILRLRSSIRQVRPHEEEKL